MRMRRFLLAQALALSLIAAPVASASAIDLMEELDSSFAPLSPPAPLPAPEAEEMKYNPPAASAGGGAATESISAAAARLVPPPAVRVRITARDHAILSSQVSGRVEEVTVRDGERFSAGGLLVRIDSSLLESQRDRARAAFQRQEILYRMTRELTDLQSKGEAEAEAMRMDVEQARADMTIAEKLLDRTKVTAPFSGRVADVLVRQNQYVGEGQPLLEILDDSRLEVEFIVSSHWLRWFAPGASFGVTVDETGRQYAAVLERLGGKVDPLSQSIKAYARLVDAGPELMEGMSGEAIIAVPPTPTPEVNR